MTNMMCSLPPNAVYDNIGLIIEEYIQHHLRFQTPCFSYCPTAGIASILTLRIQLSVITDIYLLFCLPDCLVGSVSKSFGA
jgi:hypothetical protein